MLCKRQAYTQTTVVLMHGDGRNEFKMIFSQLRSTVNLLLFIMLIGSIARSIEIVNLRIMDSYLPVL